MTFTSFTSVSEAARAVQDFLFDRDAALPDDLREKLRNLVGPTTSPVDTVVQGAEMMYARRDELAPEAQQLAAALALVAQQYNFHGMAEDNRGSKIALAMMRDSGVPKPTAVTYPTKKNDPEPKHEFLTQDVEAVVVNPDTPTPVEDVTPAPTPVEDTPPVEGARRGRGRRNRRENNTK
jgi:hypothetical protein